MGQRLVVSIKDKGVDKMKIYYHWSAYTASTFEELNKLWNDCIKPLKKAGKSTEEILLGIIKYLEGDVDETFKSWLEKLHPEQAIRSCHGGIGYFNKDSKWDDKVQKPNLELEYIQSLYPGETFSTDVDRNNGLVYMSKDGMEDAQSWSEGNASIDLYYETYTHDVNWPMHVADKEEYVKERNYDRNGDCEIEPDERKEFEQEYDQMNVYNGDGIELFEGKCDDIGKNWETWHRITGNGGLFRDTKGVVWEATM